MKRISTCCWIGFSLVLSACQTAQPGITPLGEDAICTLRPITVSPAVRAHLRQSLGEEVPAGYTRFLRDIAAHNAKMVAHCGR